MFEGDVLRQETFEKELFGKVKPGKEIFECRGVQDGGVQERCLGEMLRKKKSNCRSSQTEVEM